MLRSTLVFFSLSIFMGCLCKEDSAVYFEKTFKPAYDDYENALKEKNDHPNDVKAQKALADASKALAPLVDHASFIGAISTIDGCKNGWGTYEVDLGNYVEVKLPCCKEE